MKLKPCPFCGSNAEFSWYEGEFKGKTRRVYSVSCSECRGMVDMDTFSKEHAAEAWNRRIENEANNKRKF